jgi:hypothetical protein
LHRSEQENPRQTVSRPAMTADRPGRVALVALLIGVAFSAFYAGTSRGVFVFGDDILMYQVTTAISDHGEVSVTSPAESGDVARAIPGRDGKRYAKYGLAPSLVAWPFYAASPRLFDRFELPETADRHGNLRTGATVFGTGLANAVTGGATVAVTFLLAVELGFPLLVALATAFCLGSATLLAHYSGTSLSEPLSALCLAVAVLALVKAHGRGEGRGRSRDESQNERNRESKGGSESKTRNESKTKNEKKSSVKGGWLGRWWLAISGFAAGLGVATKAAHLVVVLPLFFWAAALGWREKRARGLIVHALYWSSCFFLWLGVVGAYNWQRFGSVFETGYGGEAGMFSGSPLAGLAGLLVSPFKGVFWFCPVLLLSLVGARAFWRRSRSGSLAILALSAAWLLLISTYYQWYGGDCWGPRFLVPLLPLWILPAAEIFARWRRGAGWKLGIALCVAVSCLAAMLPLLVPFDSVPEARPPEGRAKGVWSVAASPLVASSGYLAESLSVTAGKLAGRRPLGEAGRPASGPRFPDFAFEHYGSHALLEWSRGCFLVAVLAFAIAVGVTVHGMRAAR